ncbi:hypothetical protein [Clostridium oceanicum]|uniref:Uncharacterized protein n=1 Tax=Clostridium oceanicum TaxID=1543 RepID=A0ABN1JC35_9CLOT
MWIRSQSKEVLSESKQIIVEGKEIIDQGYLRLGTYESKDRAIEVLNMIEDRIMNGSRFDEIQNGRRKTRDFVFQMPEV